MEENNMDKVYKLLTTHWKLPKPELVISLSGGYLDENNEDIEAIFITFITGLLRTMKVKGEMIIIHDIQK